ncbi:hypothetical protein D929_00104 [Enterococcus faecalis 02-MB-P-10]|nr:hypothetical protein D929_00104 [Enterococcus faecalis 02-MB-P-10]
MIFFLYSNKLIPSPTNLIILFNKKYKFNIRVNDYILNQLLTSYFFDTSFIPISLKKEELISLNFPYFFDEDLIKYSKIVRDGKIREID